MDRICACGCGMQVISARDMTRFIVGHNLRGWKRSADESRRRSDALRLSWSKLTPEEREQRRKRVSSWMYTAKGRRIKQAAYEKAREKIISALKGRVPWNKVSDSDKTVLYCLQCGQRMLVTSWYVERKKFCSKLCKSVYQRGKPHLGYNPDSALHNYSCGRGVSGRFRGVLFRSKLELAFLVRIFDLGLPVKAEPVIIQMARYLSPINRRAFGIREGQVYIPDYLVNDEALVELKPARSCKPEADDFSQVVAKMFVLDEYAKEHGLQHYVITDEDLMAVTDKEIRRFAEIGQVMFFKERHRERYGQSGRSRPPNLD